MTTFAERFKRDVTNELESKKKKIEDSPQMRLKGVPLPGLWKRSKHGNDGSKLVSYENYVRNAISQEVGGFVSEPLSFGDGMLGASILEISKMGIKDDRKWGFPNPGRRADNIKNRLDALAGRQSAHEGISYVVFAMASMHDTSKPEITEWQAQNVAKVARRYSKCKDLTIVVCQPVGNDEWNLWWPDGSPVKCEELREKCHW